MKKLSLYIAIIAVLFGVVSIATAQNRIDSLTVTVDGGHLTVTKNEPQIVFKGSVDNLNKRIQRLEKEIEFKQNLISIYLSWLNDIELNEPVDEPISTTTPNEEII